MQHSSICIVTQYEMHRNIPGYESQHTGIIHQSTEETTGKTSAYTASIADIKK